MYGVLIVRDNTNISDHVFIEGCLVENDLHFLISFFNLMVNI